ncbi:hypothetical protein [Thermus amyloliquefaciens]|uniref:hypothetical protein n=1 Tax=Thermus amyloliquefaciens TaxID=1449080 RepID=UPI000ADF2910|nr:hypothetical protein [Thermus amyloliquefaciens]
MTDPEDYPLLRGQTALLAQALRLVSRDGYTWWQVQTAPVEKVLAAVKKLDEKHAVLIAPRPGPSGRRPASPWPTSSWPR